jgi:hypothetical protein
MTKKITVPLAKNAYFCLYVVSRLQRNEAKDAFENTDFPHNGMPGIVNTESLTALALDKCLNAYVDM